MSPKISIIIPIYNSEKYLRECLDSVVNQTLNEIEIICIVNGSTDNSLSITGEYARRDDRISIIVRDTADVGGARNSGIRAASGEYLMFVDSDDWIRLDACERLYNTAVEHDLEILQGRYKHVPDMVFKHTNYKQNLYNNVYSGIDFWMRNKDITVMNWDKIWRRDFFINNALFNSEGIYYEDNITAIKGFAFAKSFMLINFEFYYHRKVRTSITNSKITHKHIVSYYMKTHYIDSFLKEYPSKNIPCLALFHFKILFTNYALNGKEKLNEFKSKIDFLDRTVLNTFPIHIKLSYHLPGTAAFVYPFWRRISAIRIHLYRLFNRHTADTASFHRNPERGSLCS